MSDLRSCFYNARRLFHEQFIHGKLDKEYGVSIEIVVLGFIRENTATDIFSSEKPLIRSRKEKINIDSRMLTLASMKLNFFIIYIYIQYD